MLARLALLGLAALAAYAQSDVPKWTRFETSFTSASEPANPLDLDVRVTFRAPSGAVRVVPAFWDGGKTWRVRFMPNEQGRWSWETSSSPAADRGLHGQQGRFRCVRPRNGTVFEQHGPVRVSDDRRYFVHEDGTPFFWLGDTAWNGPLFAPAADWDHYIQKRRGQGYNVVMWVATQWRGAHGGDSAGRLPYSGKEQIRVNPEFFQNLDRGHDALVRAGMLSVPVMLWAIPRLPDSDFNPGISLPEDQAVRLARYMLARWGADPVVWILNGDGDYRGPLADKWKRIGKAVFDAGFWRRPVTLHPGGLIWVGDEFREEAWLDICGYQSAHADLERNSAWITTGPPSQEWARQPVRPVISLEAPYENRGKHRELTSEYFVRRNHLWSLLNAPMAGITYGVHGVWGWSDGVHPVDGHGSGVSPHWKELLDLPAGLQMGALKRFFEGLQAWRLRPAPAILAEQPGSSAVARFVSAAQTEAKDLTVLYTPVEARLLLKSAALPAAHTAQWRNAATLAESPAKAEAAGSGDLVFAAPGPGDWLLIIGAKR